MSQKPLEALLDIVNFKIFLTCSLHDGKYKYGAAGDEQSEPPACTVYISRDFQTDFLATFE